MPPAAGLHISDGATEKVETAAARPTPLTRLGELVWRGLLGAILAVTVGGILRVWAFDRGMWNDELYIAHNLRRRFVDLADAPLYKQVAPPVWLAAEKALYQVLGPDEQVLKLPQMFSAIAVVVLTVVVTRRAIGKWAAVLVAAMLAACPYLYYYAAELKQYIVESAAAMLIFGATGLLGTVLLRDRRAQLRPLLAYAAVTVLAIAFSYSALIVLGGGAAGLGLLLLQRRRWRVLLLFAISTLPGLGLGGAMALRRLAQPLATNQYDIFPTGFPPEHPSVGELLAWLPRMWQGFVTIPLGWGNAAALAPLVIAGVVALFWRGKAVWAAPLVGIYLAALATAAIRAYPLGGRVALYLVAPVLFAVTAAIDGAVRAVIATGRRAWEAWRTDPATRWRTWRRPAVAALVLVAAITSFAVSYAPGVAAARSSVAHPRYRDDARDVLRDVSARLGDRDIVLGYDFSEPQIVWYGMRQLHLPVKGLARMTTTQACRPNTVDEALKGAQRVWYVHGASFSQHPLDYHDRVVAELTKRGTVVATSKGFQGRWILVDLTKGPDPNPPRVAPNPNFECMTVAQPRRGLL